MLTVCPSSSVITSQNQPILPFLPFCNTSKYSTKFNSILSLGGGLKKLVELYSFIFTEKSLNFSQSFLQKWEISQLGAKCNLGKLRMGLPMVHCLTGGWDWDKRTSRQFYVLSVCFRPQSVVSQSSHSDRQFTGGGSSYHFLFTLTSRKNFLTFIQRQQ